MAKATTNNLKYAPPTRVVHQAGVKLPAGLLNFLQVYNGFVEKMTEEFRQILQVEEDSVAKDILELILMLESKMGYYPVSVLLGMQGRDSAVPKSYFARIDGVRGKTEVGKAIKSLTTHLVKGAELPEKLIAFKEFALKEFDDEAALRSFLESSTSYYLFNKYCSFFQGVANDPLVKKILNYDMVGSERVVILPAILNAWSGIDTSFMELVIVGSLQVLSSNRELMELWLKEEEERKANIADFEATEDGKALLAYCRRFDNGAFHYFSREELLECRSWRRPTDLTVPTGKIPEKLFGKALRLANPEIDAFLKAKKTWTDLNRGKDAPTWRPVTWDKNPHFPFLDTKFLMDLKANEGKLRANLKIPEIQWSVVEDLIGGSFPPSLGKKAQIALTLQLEKRLQGATCISDESGFTFLRQDPVSTRKISEVFKGIRFSRDKRSGYWKAWLTTEPTFEYKALFDEAMGAYWSGESPSLPPGTIVSSFVVSISPAHHPEGEIGYMTFWGIGDQGESIFLGASKVSPYQVFHGQDANRMVWDPRVNDGKGGFLKGHAKGASRCIEVNDLLGLKERITANRKAMGYPDAKLKGGENANLWTQLRWAADTLRKQTAANVMAIQAVVEGVSAERKGKKGGELKLKFSRPKRVIEFRAKYPDGCYALLLPAPMGASHQRHKVRDENRVLHLVGVAQIYELILGRAFYSGFNTLKVSKSGLFTRCAKPPRKMEEITIPNPSNQKKEIGTGRFEVTGNGHYCEGRQVDNGEANFTCPTCNGQWPRGVVGSCNLMLEFMNPAPKERKAKSKKKVSS